MGYDHFALLSIPDLKDEDLEILGSVCAEIRDEIQTDKLFGEVHHLCAGAFTDSWWDEFDEFIWLLHRKLITKTIQTPIIHLYICEFDGDSLEKHEYVEGKRTQHVKKITYTTDDDDVDVGGWNIKTLRIKNNVTYYYNSDYPFDEYN